MSSSCRWSLSFLTTLHRIACILIAMVNCVLKVERPLTLSGIFGFISKGSADWVKNY